MKHLQFDVRPFAAALHDGLALAAAFLGAMMLLIPGGIPASDIESILLAFVVAIPLQVAVNVLFGIYHGVWRYTSLPDIQRIVFAVMTGTVCVSLALRVLGLDTRLGYREYLLYPLFLITIMSISRMGFRSFKEWSLYGRGGEQGTPGGDHGRRRFRGRPGEGALAQPRVERGRHARRRREEARAACCTACA
jgi:FlaA1/EpsC-like NDP-sugar epimerase